jgi:hypothetical protein
VAAAQILHKGVPGDHHLRRPICLQAAHGSQPAHELTVIRFYAIVRVLLDVVPRRWHQFSKHGRVDRCGVGDYLARSHLQRA